MNRINTALVLATCALAPMASFAAKKSDANVSNVANVQEAKGPMVKVTLKNRSNTSQNLTIQGKPMTLAANAETKVNVPAGTQVMGEDGTVKLTIVKEYNGATASFR